ncbi:MAG TPA: CDP-alcohol phosphatidyltransferase family protein [Lacipirellulaceae bacterium]|nr:CDP-alcohol phosphatidyltransferase family protein [Lacipirellulaceae bacterium]HMP05432.1 CDP-alcohol phosphatidyltransferase family protein [Lacipirellulaceae bacterium]
MRRIRAVSLFPTIFTLGNLVCGFFAIVVASRIARPGDEAFVPAPRLESARALIASVDPTHNVMLCGVLIFVAMAFDVFDGQVARLARVTSDFGAQLDSLCDVVSFGVAPGILLVKMCPQFTEYHSEAIWCIAALYACCAAMRLARFNAEADDEDDHEWFEGLPSPAAAAVIAGAALLCYRMRNEINFASFQEFDWWFQRLLPPFALVVALLMVSRVPYPHAVNYSFRGQKSFPQLVAIVFALMGIWAVRWYAAPVLAGAYALAPAAYHGWQWAGQHWPFRAPRAR